MEPTAGIEPACPPWQGGALPLSYVGVVLGAGFEPAPPALKAQHPGPLDEPSRCGPCGSRTRDLLHAMQARYRLRQQPVTAGVPSRGDRLGLIGAVGGTGLRNRTAPLLVGIAGFEPATSATRKQRAPKLRHIPLRPMLFEHVRVEPGTGLEPATIRLQGGRSTN